MIKTDLFLKFDTKEQAESVLTGIGAKVENDMIASYASFYGLQTSIDVLFGTGTIYSPTGDTHEMDGLVVPVMAAVPGYHVNVRMIGDFIPPELEPFMIDPTPNNPKCVFAGG